MRYPQMIVFELDGRIAWLLKPLCEERRWALREARQVEACLRLLRSGGPAILVVRIAGKPVQERSAEEGAQDQKLVERSFVLLERAHRLRPDALVLAVSECSEPALAALAWDLGVSYLLEPPQPLSSLRDLAGHLMTGAPPLLPAAGAVEE